MVVQCVDNDGFEDVLTLKEFYQAERGVNGYMIQNDRGRWCWYGSLRFELVSGTVV